MRLFRSNKGKNSKKARSNGSVNGKPSPNGNGFAPQPPQQRPFSQPTYPPQQQAPPPPPPSKNGKAKPEKKSRRKKRASKRRSKAFFNEQMNDVQLPLDLADPNGNVWMHFPSEVVDNLRHMMTRVGRTGELPERMAIVSAHPDEGVTYISRALATVMANDLAARVCLVDLNWWSAPAPQIAPVSNNGLVSVVTGEERLDEVFIPTSLPNLTLIPAGYLDRGDRPVMARSNVLASALDVLGRYFDHLILDIPAIRATNDAIPLATLAGNCVFVMRQGITPQESMKKALDEIQHLNVIGTVMNQVEFHTPDLLLRYIPQD